MSIRDRECPEIVAAALDVTVRFGSAVALDDVSLIVRRGAAVALLGPNGAGKTTLVNVLVGLRRPRRGRVVLFGRSPRDWRARRALGVVLQEMSFLPHSRAVEVLELVRAHHPTPVPTADLLRRFNLDTLAHSDVRRLSPGQRRRLVIAMAFAGRPRLLVLDEPLAALDLESQALVRRELARHVADGGSVVLTTHEPEEVAALATHAVLLRGGRVVASGTVTSLTARLEDLRRSAPPRGDGDRATSSAKGGIAAPSGEAGRPGPSTETPALETPRRWAASSEKTGQLPDERAPAVGRDAAPGGAARGNAARGMGEDAR